MHIGRSIDAARRRVVLRVPEGASGRTVLRAIDELYRSRPEVTSFDFIFNLLRFDGGLTNADVEAGRVAYDRHPREPGIKYTAIVTLDPNFPLWAETMDPLFGDRRHRVFQTQAEAEAWIDDVRGMGVASDG